jgi:hypothetical protein
MGNAFGGNIIRISTASHQYSSIPSNILAITHGRRTHRNNAEHIPTSFSLPIFRIPELT